MFVQWILLTIFQLQTVKAGGDSFESPLPSFNTDICAYTQSWDGRIFCLVTDPKPYDEAEATCAASGMKLLTVNDAAGKENFQKTLDDIGVGFYDTASGWINGKKIRSTWYTFPPYTPLTSSLTSSGELDGPGECLQVYKTSRFEPVKFSAEDCDVPKMFGCEQIP